MIPQFESIRIQILKILASGKDMRAKDLREPLAHYFNLSEEELNAEYASGNGNIFLDRISWALSYLFIAGLVERPHRGVYRISSTGIEQLNLYTDVQINEYITNTVKAKTPNRKNHIEGATDDIKPTVSVEHTPRETLDISYDNIKNSISSEILTTILSKKPQEFERLVVKLLQCMGYGGEVKDSGTVTPLSNDGGIDGIIKEDVLGFNHILIQAKRYSPGHNICRDDVQSFVGAVAVAPSRKGVFVTTSDFTDGARKYVQSLNGNPRIILIDGRQLTEYIYDYGLGMQTEKVLEIKKIDMDYWDLFEDAD